MTVAGECYAILSFETSKVDASVIVVVVVDSSSFFILSLVFLGLNVHQNTIRE
jgi:hypothetical protein